MSEFKLSVERKHGEPLDEYEDRARRTLANAGRERWPGELLAAYQRRTRRPPQRNVCSHRTCVRYKAGLRGSRCELCRIFTGRRRL